MHESDYTNNEKHGMFKGLMRAVFLPDTTKPWSSVEKANSHLRYRDKVDKYVAPSISQAVKRTTMNSFVLNITI